MNIPDPFQMRKPPVVVCAIDSVAKKVSKGGKLHYLLTFRIDEGEHAGTELTRTLWATEKGEKVLRQDCEVLGVRVADDLLNLRKGSVRVQGGVVHDWKKGVLNLAWIGPAPAKGVDPGGGRAGPG